MLKVLIAHPGAGFQHLHSILAYGLAQLLGVPCGSLVDHIDHLLPILVLRKVLHGVLHESIKGVLVGVHVPVPKEAEAAAAKVSGVSARLHNFELDAKGSQLVLQRFRQALDRKLAALWSEK